MVGGIELQGLKRTAGPTVGRKLLAGMYQDEVQITGGTINGVALGAGVTFADPGSLYSSIVLPYADATNVKLFGATGNGITNDTTALQATINAVSLAGGGGVYVPIGTYIISTTLSLPGNIQLIGSGKGSIIKAADNSIDLLRIVSAFNVVRGISFQNGNAAIRLYGLTAEVTNNIIEDVYSNQANYGLVLDGYTNTNFPTYWNQFRDVLIDRPKIHGVWLTKSGAGDSPNANKFHNVRVYSHGNTNTISGSGFYIEYGQFNNSFIDCEANLATSAHSCFRFGANARTTMLINPYAETQGAVTNYRLEAGSLNTVLINALSASAGSAISDASGGNYSTYNSGFPVKNRLLRTTISDTTLSKLQYNSQAVTGDLTLTGATITVPVYAVSSFAAPVAFTLPNANDAEGVTIKVIKTDVSDNVVTITETGGNGPDQRSQILSTQYDFVDLYSNGANWFILGGSSLVSSSFAYSAGGTFNPDMQRSLYLISATAGATSVVLPVASSVTAKNRYVTFQKTDASVNAVTLTVSGAANIGGFANYILPGQYQSVTVYSNGSQWFYTNAVGQYYFPINTTGSLTVAGVTNLNAATAINAAGGTVAGTSPVLTIGGGTSPTAGNIIAGYVNKSGTQGLLFGVNKNSATGSVPANGTFLSTYTSSGTLTIGRGNSAGNPNTADIAIDASGNTTINGNLTVTGTASVPVFPGNYRNLASTWASTTSLTITADSVVVGTTGGLTYITPAVNATLNLATTGANGLDTGALAVSSWYYTYIIYNGTTVAGLASLSATAPTMPSGYTYKMRVGSFRTNSSAQIIGFKQAANQTRYVVGNNLTALPIMASGTSGSATTPTYTATPVGAFVPVTASLIDLVLVQQASSQTIVAPNASYGGFGSTTNAPPLTNSQINMAIMGRLELESVNIYYASNSGSAYLACYGYQDNL